MAAKRKVIHAKGTLAISARGPVLLLDGGGEWEIGHSPASTRLMGRRVEVTGHRAGYNELACNAIWREGTVRPRRPKLNIEFCLVAAVILCGLLASLKGIVG